MAYCRKCGAELKDEDQFCAKCGTKVNEEASAENTTTSIDIDMTKLYAVLAYIGILFLFPLLLCKDSEFVRFHTNQGIILFIASVICAVIPIVGWIASIGVLVLMVFGLINVSNGEMKELPVIGKFRILK